MRDFIIFKRNQIDTKINQKDTKNPRGSQSNCPT